MQKLSIQQNKSSAIDIKYKFITQNFVHRRAAAPHAPTYIRSGVADGKVLIWIWRGEKEKCNFPAFAT